MFAKLRIRTALVFGLILSVPAMASAATVALAWNANPEGNIAGYILVYGTTPGSYSSSVDVGSTTAHSISSLTAGTRYYFAVRAYNTSGVSGPLSGEVNEVPTDAPPPPPPPAVELVAAYGFGEASGSSALDKTTNNNDGTLAAGVTRTAAGRFGNAVVFNGVDGIVTIPSTASLDMTSAFTLEAWVNPSAAGGWRTVVMKQSSGGHTYVLYSDTGSSGPSGHVQTSSDRTATTPAPLALNTWAHVAAVSDGTTLRVLVNGQQTASVSVLAGVVSSTAPLGIGGNLVWGEYFAGTIDEVRIYRGALTDAQVQQDMITAVEPTGPDTTAPTVSVTSPASGSAVAGSVNITATAADNVAVAGVRFAVDGVNSGSEDVTAPYALSWNTTTVPNGSHTLTAIARDSSGNLKTSAAVTVTVANGDTTNPTVSITSPVNGASVTGSISITATAADAVAVSGVRFLLDGVSLGTEDLTAPYAQAWNSTTTTNGSHALTAIARDSSGNVKTSATVTVTITNDTGQPSVTSVSPANGASGVAQSAFVTATFSEPMAPASISSSTFELRNAAGALVTAAVTYDQSSRTARLTPSASLTMGATFTATVKGGAGGVTDVAGNLAATHTAWSFSVAAQTSVGPVAVYGFDEGTGSIARDGSGNQLDGTILGATWQAGRFGNALAFNGVDNWLTVADHSAIDFTTSLTIEAWVNPTSISGWRAALLKEAPGGLSYALYANDDTPNPAGTVRISGIDSSAVGTSPVPLNTWTHLASTYDGSQLRLYVNGVLVGSRALTGGLQTSTSPLRIGGNAVWGEYFAGRIDEVRLYNRALSAAEIATDMGTPITGSTSLAAAYGFNETAGTVTADLSGHALNGTVTAATWTAGKFGNGLEFNGVNSWVTVADSNWLDLTTGMTLEAWIKPTVGGGWQTVLMKETATGHTFALYSDGTGGPGAHAQTSADVISNSGVPLPLNVWTHLAATYDGTTLRLFVNGVQASSRAMTGAMVASSLPLRIGGNSVWGEQFAGVIDEVRIYNRALTAAEITADMNTPVR